MNYYKNLASASLSIGVFVLLLSPLSFIRAQESTVSTQEQCFTTLKADMAEAKIFEGPLAELQDKSYADVAALFGEKKKMLQSFDLTIDQPILGIRLYSFGTQTGYTHPPKSALPDSYKSDTWGDPVKEYVVAEEYVTDPQGNEHFLDCVFIHIASDDLMSVTEKNYAHDGTAISLLKEAADASSKSWYYEVPSFNYQNEQFASWERLIVYPKSTQNTYFNRYDVIDTYLVNKVANFSVLSFFLQDMMKVDEFDQSTGSSIIKYLSITETGETVELTPDAALLPVAATGINALFPRTAYYQAIESMFPEFASLLSMRGTLKYSTFKALVSGESVNPEIIKFFTALSDSQAIDAYYLSMKDDGEQGVEVASPDAERLLPLVQHGDWTVAQILNGATFDSLVYTEPATAVLPAQEEAQPSKVPLLVLVVALLLVTSALIIFLRKRHIINSNTPTV